MHGDLKPVGDFPSFVATSSELYLQTNILIDDDGSALLSDFGTTRPRGEEPTLFQSSRIIENTIAYAAPETLESAPPSTESDIFSFAWVILGTYPSFPLLETGSDPTKSYSQTIRLTTGRTVSRLYMALFSETSNQHLNIMPL